MVDLNGFFLAGQEYTKGGCNHPVPFGRRISVYIHLTLTPLYYISTFLPVHEFDDWQIVVEVYHFDDVTISVSIESTIGADNELVGFSLLNFVNEEGGWLVIIAWLFVYTKTKQTKQKKLQVNYFKQLYC